MCQLSFPSGKEHPMNYNFEIIGVAPIWNFFKHQQSVEQSPERGCAYLGSYDCTLDGFIKATNLVHQRPNWDWDAVVAQMVRFWLHDSDRVSVWKQELEQAKETSLVIARVANFKRLRSEFQSLFEL